MKITKKTILSGLLCIVIILICIYTFFDFTQIMERRKKLVIGVFSDSYWEVQNGYSYKIIDDAILAFEKKHPEIKVVYESGLMKEDYSNWLSERLLEGDAPDVFMVLPEDFNDFVKVGSVKDLSSLIENDKDFSPDVFYSSAYASGLLDDTPYALPYECAPKMMFVNKTILKNEGIEVPKEGWTWDDFYNICEKVTKDTDGNGSIDQFGTVGYTWEEAFYSNNVELFSDNGNVCNFTGQNIEEAILFIEKLGNLNGAYVPKAKDFDLGKVAFQPLSFAEYRAYKPYPLSVKKYSDFEWEYISMPAGPLGDNVSSLDTLLIAMNGKTKNQKYAWEFLKLLSSDSEIQSEIFLYSEGVSVLKEVTGSKHMLKQLPDETVDNSLNQKMLIDAMENASIIPKFKDAEAVIAEVDKAVNSIICSNQNVSMQQIIWNRTLNAFLKK